jgi:quinol monooxygenase YgiN
MFARMIQLTAKAGQANDLNKIMQERAVSLLRQQAGFVDVLGLRSDTDPNQFVGITVWKSKADAENYVQSSQAQQLLQSMKPLLQGEPIFRTFDLVASASLQAGIGRGAS